MKKAVLVSSTEQKHFCTQKVLPCQNDAFDLKAGEAQQTIRGFGGCFNELGWYALEKLSSQDRKRVMDALFSKEGCDFGYCRIPIGASDYARTWYSHNETEGDFAMEHFSIDHDKKALLPFIREAQAIRPDLRFFASPWSPPTWMKNPPVYNFGYLREEDEYRKAYALYLLKFIQAYHAEGVPVEALFLQNEPASHQKFPSCQWKGEHLRRFLREDIGPLFEANGYPAQLWLGTINSPYDDFGGEEWQTFGFHRMAEVVLRDPEARRHISGIGCQWGGKHTLAELSRAFPEVEIVQTENECGDGENSWGYMEYCFRLFWYFMEHGTTAYTYWNMLLEQGGSSSWGWKQNSLFTVDGGKLVENPEYCLMWHVAHFVKPGARFLRSQGNFSCHAACFGNPDGSEIAVILNPLETKQTLHIELGGTGWTIEMEPHSIQTLCVAEQE